MIFHLDAFALSLNLSDRTVILCKIVLLYLIIKIQITLLVNIDKLGEKQILIS